MIFYNLIKRVYDFDLFDHVHKVPDKLKGVFVLIALIGPTIAIPFLLFEQLPNFDNLTFTFAGFSKSGAISIEGSDKWLILLACLMFLRYILNAILAPVDLLVRSKQEGKPVAWEDVFVFGSSSLLIVLTGVIFVVETPLLNLLIDFFGFLFSAMDSVEPLVNIPITALLIIIYILDDVFFYIGHRLAHNVRVMWKLGHMQHHRSTTLSMGTQVGDFSLFFLNGGAGSFLTGVIGKAFFIKLLSDADTSDAMFGAVVVAILGIINHGASHSYSAYVLFSKYKWLSWFEKYFVTGRVHYVHHSKLPEHNIASGCNFAAQFTVIDRALGTYAPAPKEIPPTGLFHEARPPGNPFRYAFDQWIRMGRELCFNSPKYWPKILFADPSYEPPTPAYRLKRSE